jgi:hypothetical protein
MHNENAITVYLPHDSLKLPDNRDWTNRFDIPSSSSNRVYTIAQHRQKRHWGCSCPGWRRYRHCHHLDELGIPGNERPYEAVLNA